MPNTKWCPQCRAERPVSEFYKSVRGDGLSSYCITHHSEAVKRSGQAKRAALIEAMGGCCEQCGFSDLRALQIDHVNSDGRLERAEKRTGTAAFYRKVLANREQYALLCANCNTIKKHEQNETVGDRIYTRQVPTERIVGPGKGSAPGSKAAIARARTSEHQREASKAGWADVEKREARIEKLREAATGRKLVDGHWVRPG